MSSTAMIDLILSTGNIMGAAAASAGYQPQKSNQELVRSLRMNIEEAQRGALVEGAETNGNVMWKRWTSLQDSGKTLYIPAVDFTASSLVEDRDSYDITVKLFHLHPATAEERERHTRHALSLVLRELHMPSVDLFIVSYPSVSLDDTIPDCESNGTSSKPIADPEPISSLLESWEAGPAHLSDESLVRRLGVSEFGVERLAAFLQTARVPPAVDQINLGNYCDLPKDLLGLAKQHGVELLIHNDCTNILPDGTVRELLGSGPRGAGILTSGAKESGIPSRICGDVTPRWVIKYTAVVRDRGVVENKGYFALAEVQS